MLICRAHGDPSGIPVIVIHGGPSAPGTVRSLAAALGRRFYAIEPFQRARSAQPLTVAQHVADLHEVVGRTGGSRPGLVGHSWGAMLALAYAAAHPGAAGPLVLVGCGTFDPVARDRLRRTLAGRRERGDCDPYHVDLLETDDRVEGELDEQAHGETWQDMLRCQERGLYPAAFAAIRSPVLMLHGAWDPHPGQLIRDSLRPHLPHLEYREWPHCGHDPWRERAAREPFMEALSSWLAKHLGDSR